MIENLIYLQFFPIPAFLRRRRKKAKEGFAIDGVFFYQSGFQNWYITSVAKQHVQKNKTKVSTVSK